MIKFVEENPSWRKKDVAEKFGLKPNTLSDILKNRDKIVHAVEQPKDVRKGSFKRMKQVTFDDVEAALLAWFRQKEALPELRLDGEMLLNKAHYFAKELGYDTLPSLAWIDRFKKRHGIGRIQKAGEAAGVNTDVVEEWKNGALQDILNR